MKFLFKPENYEFDLSFENATEIMKEVKSSSNVSFGCEICPLWVYDLTNPMQSQIACGCNCEYVLFCAHETIVNGLNEQIEKLNAKIKNDFI